MDNLNFDIEIPGFDFDSVFADNLNFDFDFLNQHENRYSNPKKTVGIKKQNLLFKYALDLAEKINIGKNESINVICSGNFIFGDFIEAFFVKKNIQTKKLIISTLSMSQENIDSLKNLFVGNYVLSLDLLISDYFFANEKNALIKYMLQELDVDNKFQLSVARSHTKICIFEDQKGNKYVFQGSANLRSSDCIEQLICEENSESYDFYFEHHERIKKEYQIINQTLTNKRLWQAVVKDFRPTTLQERQQQAEGEVIPMHQNQTIPEVFKPD